MAGRLEGKISLITGGGSGIGKASALAFAREGSKVVVADINVDGGEETVRIIQDTGGEATFVRADVSKASDVTAMVSHAVHTYNRLDCAFNNAGVAGSRGRIHEYSEDDWSRVLDINLTGVWLCMKHEIIQMLNQGGGAIVNTASVMGLVGGSRSPAYAATKHGVVGLTKTAAVDYAREGIRVNAVCPGYIRTPMIEQGILSDLVAEERVVSRHPMNRLGTPEEIAETVVWLCSDAASFVTGHAMAVDGGYVAW